MFCFEVQALWSSHLPCQTRRCVVCSLGEALKYEMLCRIGALYPGVVGGILHPLCLALILHEQQMYALPRECFDYCHELLQRNSHKPPFQSFEMLFRISNSYSITFVAHGNTSNLQLKFDPFSTLNYVTNFGDLQYTSDPGPPLWVWFGIPMLCTTIQECQIHVCIPSNAANTDIEPKPLVDFPRSPWRPGLPRDDVYKDVIPICFDMCMYVIENLKTTQLQMVRL